MIRIDRLDVALFEARHRRRSVRARLPIPEREPENQCKRGIGERQLRAKDEPADDDREHFAQAEFAARFTAFDSLPDSIAELRRQGSVHPPFAQAFVERILILVCIRVHITNRISLCSTAGTRAFSPSAIPPCVPITNTADGRKTRKKSLPRPQGKKRPNLGKKGSK